MTVLIPLIPVALPLAGFAITGLLGGRGMGRESHQIAVWAVVASWLVAIGSSPSAPWPTSASPRPASTSSSGTGSPRPASTPTSASSLIR